MNRAQFEAALESDLKNKYTSVGYYPVYLVLRDGACLCWACVHKEKALIAEAAESPTTDHDTGWEPVGADVNWEDSQLFCDNCNERIESAYGES